MPKSNIGPDYVVPNGTLVDILPVFILLFFLENTIIPELFDINCTEGYVSVNVVFRLPILCVGSEYAKYHTQSIYNYL